ncbi:general odorant-binding protein 45-like [Malaya genurostris]|uniref:general odorant-binding protein 45-like n=1 Tax=Malaya genurostris TaxID=325434 RepID=UPI0026F3F689|nr:general odorant-binding protein 45-like [Malaya genurostris]
MKMLTGLLLAAMMAIASGQNYRLAIPLKVEQSYFAYQLKSFRQALDECADVLAIPLEVVDRFAKHSFATNEPPLRCLVRCAGLSLGWWNDTAGIQSTVMESFFQPALDDAFYAGRTRECIDAKRAVCLDDCSRAYETFLCFFHQYGKLRFSREYVPLTALEAVQAAVDCINILQISPELIEQYSRGIFPECQETKCLYRCQYLAEGLYDTRHGFDLRRLYAREHKMPDLQLLNEGTKICTDLALSEGCDECTRFYRAHKCFDRCGESDHTAAILVQASWVVLEQNTCQNFNPFYLFPPYAPLQPHVPLKQYIPRYLNRIVLNKSNKMCTRKIKKEV